MKIYVSCLIASATAISSTERFEFGAMVEHAARFVSKVVPERHLPSAIRELDLEPLNSGSNPLLSSVSDMLAEAEELGISSFDNLRNVSTQFPYFGFIPKSIGAAVVGQEPLTWESRCWKTNTATLEKDAKTGDYELYIHVSGSKAGDVPFACADYYGFLTTAKYELATFPTPVPSIGKGKKYTYPLKNLTTAETYDIAQKGVRINLFRGTVHDVTVSLAKTVEMLSPLIGKCCSAPSKAAVTANLDFLKNYRALDMPTRTAPMLDVTVADQFIKSGDFLGVIRLDGLDPTLAWAMGSTTGHTCICMRNETNGELFVMESTTNGSYWPTNGIQATPFATWMTQAQTAGHHVVHTPLTTEARKVFDAQKAWDFFSTQKDLDYGFGTLLVGWVDSTNDNFPCLPPYKGVHHQADGSDWDPIADSNYCLTWDLVEVGFPLASHISSAVDQIYLEAWNHRIGVKATGPSCEGCLPAAEVLMRADMNTSHIPGGARGLFEIVEQDNWVYSQQYNNGTLTQNAAMVCDVFVCRMWKAGGLFGALADEINCGEFTNLDAYDLKILDPAPKLPADCTKNDPGNPHCQLLGKHKMKLNNVGMKENTAHMAEKCVGRAPAYGNFGSC